MACCELVISGPAALTSTSNGRHCSCSSIHLILPLILRPHRLRSLAPGPALEIGRKERVTPLGGGAVACRRQATMPRCDPNVAAGVKQQRGHHAVAAAERSSTSTSNVILTYGQRRASAMVTTWGSGRMGRPGLVPAPSAASARTQRCMHLDHEVRYRAQGSSL